ncbi:MAG: hypothetical protein IPJ26_13990 [Bacteroidetes bacterium]|nr:hypothetical protein [Bacteroidota bacterium]
MEAFLPIGDDVQISRVQVFPPIGNPTRPYFNPTIKSNTSATAKILTVSNLDTLIINASTPSANALRLAQDLINNGRISVVSSLSTNFKYGNGIIPNNIYTPFKAQSTDARSQIIYSAAELTLNGLIGGDRINGIQFSLWSKGSSASFGNFTVSYALVPFTQHASNIPYAGALTTVYGPTAITTNLGVNTLNLTNPIVWDGSSNLLIQYCFDNASNIGSSDDCIYITQTTGIKSTLILSSTTNAGAGCAMIPGAGVTDNFFSGLNSFRPNFTFLVDRPYSKVVFAVQRDWFNNGFFDAGYSQVLMDGTLAQNITGTQPTLFNELNMNKGAANQTVTMQRSFSVDSSLILTQGSMLMNAFTLTMNNPSVNTGNLASPKGAFERTNGFLISENANAAVIWKNLNALTGYRVIPFGNAAVASPLYIPFSFTHNAGSLGDLSISTYNAVGNLPFPPTVTHINSASTGLNNAAAVVDRYWVLSKTGANPNVNIVYRFTNAERPAGMSAFNQGKAQPYRITPVVDLWLRLITPFTSVSYVQSY